MELWKYAASMEIELTSADIEETLAEINRRNLEIHNLRYISELTCQFWIRLKDFTFLAKLCEKRGETIHILRKRGVWFRLKDMISHPILAVGVFVLFLLIMYLPTRVFFVHVEGNGVIPDKKIMEAAESCGITFGASRREVRSEKTKNALLEAVPELQWAGVNTSGCVAIISVRERPEVQPEEEETAIAGIVAERDGYVLSCTVTRGNALVFPGQSVRAGQLLISGYTDCGRFIRAARAEGEIMAQTNRSLEAVTPSICHQKKELTTVKRKISLLLRKKRINLWKDSGIWDTTCGRMYEEYYVTLPGGFRLPLALCVEEYTICQTAVLETEQEEAEKRLRAFAGEYLLDQMVAGRILHSRQNTVLKDGVYRLEGKYVCTEMIGKIRQEQIGDTNGKNG